MSLQSAHACASRTCRRTWTRSDSGSTLAKGARSQTLRSSARGAYRLCSVAVAAVATHSTVADAALRTFSLFPLASL